MRFLYNNCVRIWPSHFFLSLFFIFNCEILSKSPPRCSKTHNYILTMQYTLYTDYAIYGLVWKFERRRPSVERKWGTRVSTTHTALLSPVNPALSLWQVLLYPLITRASQLIHSLSICFCVITKEQYSKQNL